MKEATEVLEAFNIPFEHQILSINDIGLKAKIEKFRSGQTLQIKKMNKELKNSK